MNYSKVKQTKEMIPNPKLIILSDKIRKTNLMIKFKEDGKIKYL